jgi:hypothetical protein
VVLLALVLDVLLSLVLDVLLALVLDVLLALVLDVLLAVFLVATQEVISRVGIGHYLGKEDEKEVEEDEIEEEEFINYICRL